MWSSRRRIRAEQIRDVTSSDPPVQPPRNRRRMTVMDSARFLQSVKREFTGERYKYDEFIEIVCDFRRGRLDTAGVISCVEILFDGYPNLIQGFNAFLPEEHQINI